MVGLGISLVGRGGDAPPACLQKRGRQIKKLHLETFWMPPFSPRLSFWPAALLKGDYYLGDADLPSERINPLEILVLFISMTFLSIVLDEAGFFAYLASKAVRTGERGANSSFLAFFMPSRAFSRSSPATTSSF
jgi:hypothetical protein